MDQIERIREQGTALAREIREYVRGAKDDWRRVPWLAMHTYYKGSSFEGRYGVALQDGYWPIKLPSEKLNVYSLFVDCETGEIVRRKYSLASGSEAVVVAEDSLLLELAGHVDQVDTKKIIKDAEASIAKYEASLKTPAQKKRTIEHQQYLKSMFKLKPIYTRSARAKAKAAA